MLMSPYFDQNLASDSAIKNKVSIICRGGQLTEDTVPGRNGKTADPLLGLAVIGLVVGSR